MTPTGVDVADGSGHDPARTASSTSGDDSVSLSILSAKYFVAEVSEAVQLTVSRTRDENG